METIVVEVGWSGNNYSGGWGYKGVGAVLATGKTIQALKEDFESALQFHIGGMVEDGDTLPSWLVEGAYSIEYRLDAAALIRSAEEFTTMAAISRASGINQKQLSHYANGTKKPRPAQRDRIIEGLHKIGKACIAMY